ncbi:DUF768 domain-containing protein [Mesorhizobium sp. M1060]|uniref:DUF768 domain-containing protein n=1 Tax=unclassified Mesorhizobium TaxID=325217 RepID=UPI0003CDFD9D|nr:MULTISPECIES: DUF768 domain-containing protein [unclassified Mesorhizobium]ESW88665.1 hypothetical protein X770_15470 [Mesorhizobium sp. LSJC269B00]ESX57863.1 hypothetical protein X761_07815 [Mesorhizobium sp. LSHC424B00]ESX75400.1 hypothetical protein X758_04145 [Mesorhizobium sp. LSHC416B00]ESZ07226.1 hypothetical protein X736_12805 [Mesorhizobium sp. L2C089B000]WJI52907.1 DUF768 domain-containing protein [Mesorhizobium sp. C089B]
MWRWKIPITIGDLKDQLMTAAEKAGIDADEINGEVETVFELLLEVMRRRQVREAGH